LFSDPHKTHKYSVGRKFALAISANLAFCNTPRRPTTCRLSNGSV